MTSDDSSGGQSTLGQTPKSDEPSKKRRTTKRAAKGSGQPEAHGDAKRKQRPDSRPKKQPAAKKASERGRPPKGFAPEPAAPPDYAVEHAPELVGSTDYAAERTPEPAEPLEESAPEPATPPMDYAAERAPGPVEPPGYEDEHAPEREESPNKPGGDAGPAFATGSISDTMIAAKLAPESSGSQKEPKNPVPILEWDVLKGILIVIAIIAIAALSLFYAMSHNLLRGVTHTTTLTTSTSTTALTTIVPMKNITVHTGNASYSGNSTIQVSGAVSPVPSSSGSAVLVSVTNPNGAQVEAIEVPLSASGHFETAFVGGVTSAWINGTYTITSNYYGLSGRTTFGWASAQPTGTEGILISTLCNVYTSVHNTIFLLCIMLMLFGAGVYAFGHIMPGAHKGQFQSYGMGLIIGAIIGIILAVLAPYILRVIAGNALPIASCAANQF